MHHRAVIGMFFASACPSSSPPPPPGFLRPLKGEVVTGRRGGGKASCPSNLLLSSKNWKCVSFIPSFPASILIGIYINTPRRKTSIWKIISWVMKSHFSCPPTYLITKYWMITANKMATVAKITRSRNANCSSLRAFRLLFRSSGAGSEHGESSSCFWDEKAVLGLYGPKSSCHPVESWYWRPAHTLNRYSQFVCTLGTR